MLSISFVIVALASQVLGGNILAPTSRDVVRIQRRLGAFSLLTDLDLDSCVGGIGDNERMRNGCSAILAEEPHDQPCRARDS